MNSTTKSCSTYLSQKLPHFRHTVSRMLCPLDLSPAPEYEVHSVLTGCRHSMQMGIGARARRAPGAVPGAMRGREARRVVAVPLVQGGGWEVVDKGVKVDVILSPSHAGGHVQLLYSRLPTADV